MKPRMSASTVSRLALCAALAWPTIAAPQLATECIILPEGSIPEGCEQLNAGDTVTMPATPNTEWDRGAPVANSDGFVLALDGEPLDADPRFEDRIRKTDIALAEAEVIVQVNTLDPVPVLDLEVGGAQRAYGAGDTVTLISETNYPAFIERGEVRLIDRAAVGGPRLLGTVPITPNGATSVVLPEGMDIVAVLRVYDARGRYDETVQLPLMQPDDRGQIDNVEEGTQSTARRGIRVQGGTVTVSATDMRRGAVLRTMGETVRPDARGRAVIERILPSGDYDIGVAVEGGGQNLAVERPVRVSGAEWFYVATGDLTFGRYKDGQTGESDTRVTGRLQGYVDGETEGGTRVTASIDTGEGELDEIFSRLDEKDPASTIERIDALDGYPTYGDDSTIVDNTPTSGRIFVRIEQDNSFLQLGDGQATLAGNGYVRNERTLYGLTGHYESQTTTARGDARVSVDAYVAQADQLRGRDVFRGTGGSVYFLEQQDLSPGTEVVTVELRDAITGRIIDQVRLVEGRDYQINHLQGVVTLNQPLTDSVDGNLISTNPGGDAVYNLVVQYEFTPLGPEVDGLSYGARVEAWVTDDVRIGVSTTLDDDGVDEQRTTGVDLRY